LGGRTIVKKQINKTFHKPFLLLSHLPFFIIIIVLLIIGGITVSSPNYQPIPFGCYATVFWYGPEVMNLFPLGHCQFLPQLVQYHTFPLEYPPFSLVLFSLPLLLPFISYPLGFIFCMALIVIIVYLILLRYGPKNAGFIYAIYLLVASFGTIFTNFDIVPAGLSLICLILAKKRHWTSAYLILGLGVLIKAYPIMLYPILFIAEQHDLGTFYNLSKPLTTNNLIKKFGNLIRSIKSWRLNNSLYFFALLIGVTSFFGLLNLNGAIVGYSIYFLNRPFEVASIGSVILWIMSLFGSPVKWTFSFSSLNILSSNSNTISIILFILLFLGYIYLLFLVWQNKINLGHAFITSLLITLSTGKVFSPQYLIWLIPLIAYCGSKKKIWWCLWGIVSLLTTDISTGFFTMVGIIKIQDIPLIPGFMPMVVVRDIFFILITLMYLFNLFNIRQPDSSKLVRIDNISGFFIVD